MNCYTDWQRTVVKRCTTRTVLGMFNQAAADVPRWARHTVATAVRLIDSGDQSSGGDAFHFVFKGVHMLRWN